MDEKYFPEVIEEKWQKRWAESRVFEAREDDTREKFYCLEMLPYPSGYLHMGHARNYTLGDVLSWYKRLQGYNVLHPIGWDSFGQPAEQAAIKRGVNPRTWTEENIEQMRGQFKRLGFSYDWTREIAAHRPEYYRFDQWFFLKMYERGLAYKKDSLVNWCPTCETTLSNEQASGGLCWRCGNAVEKQARASWFLKITAYAEQLLADMKELEGGWAENVLAMQRNWIGKSEGAFVDFAVKSSDEKIRVFTTRIDTIYGANAVVVAAEHAIIENHQAEFADEVLRKIEQIREDKLKVTALDEEVEKDGIFTGLFAVNPFNGEELPIWIANYVLIEYGTGAVMSVPAHDDRDWDFAVKYNLPIERVIVSNPENKNPNVQIKASNLKVKPFNVQMEDYNFEVKPFNAEVNLSKFEMITTNEDIKSLNVDINNAHLQVKSLNVDMTTSNSKVEATDTQVETSNMDDLNPSSEMKLQEVFSEYGVLINSGDWSGKTSADAKREMANFAASSGFGEAATTYRLRDWGISRQRFWGAPIPIIYCDDCGAVAERYENLPVRLPDNVQITGTGESPLAKVAEFVNVNCPNCGGNARRETDTMDTFVDSSWYFYRYVDPKNEDEPIEKQLAARWIPVDQYIGGIDHAVMHLLYARFWTKVMRDMGIVSINEPFKRLLNQGMVVGETYFDDSTGKATYYPKDAVRIERDGKGRTIGATLKENGASLNFAVERMSKSKGNGVNPDEMISIYGSDAARIYVLFSAPAENELVWNDAGIEGAVRFIQRVWRFVWRWESALQKRVVEPQIMSPEVRKLRQKTHETIRRVTDDFDRLQLNTPVAALMELSNALGDIKDEPSKVSDEMLFAIGEAVKSLILMLAPYAPHVAEEMFAAIVGNEKGILQSGVTFPVFNAELAQKQEIEIPVQVNGKLRSRLFVAPETPKSELETLALNDEKTREYTDGKEIVKVVVVPNRLVNVVVK